MALLAEAFDAKRHHVARFEEDLRLHARGVPVLGRLAFRTLAAFRMFWGYEAVQVVSHTSILTSLDSVDQRFLN